MLTPEDLQQITAIVRAEIATASHAATELVRNFETSLLTALNLETRRQ